MTVRTLPPIVSATLTFFSAVPVIAVIRSLALMTLSEVTTSRVGASGARVSTVICRVPAEAETLPATSVATTESVAAPSPIAATSSAVNW